MCKHGIYKDVYVLKSNHNPIKVDSCIADEIEDLNKSGVVTVGSCCGHGEHRAVALIESGILIAIHNGYEPKPFFYSDGEKSELYTIELKAVNK